MHPLAQCEAILRGAAEDLLEVRAHPRWETTLKAAAKMSIQHTGGEACPVPYSLYFGFGCKEDAVTLVYADRNETVAIGGE